MDAAQLEPAARNAGFGWDREPTGVPIWVGVDGWVLPDDVPTIFAKGQQNDVPLIVGSNADEGSGLVPSTLTRDRFLDGAKRRFGSNLESFLRAYPATSDADAVSAEMARMRDERFGWEGRTWARMQTRKGKSKAYLYYFSRTPPGRNVSGWVGAVHGVEIPYVFNWVNSPQGPVLPWHDVDRSLARQVSEYWVNLASKGDPNGRGLVTWPPYEPAADLAMHLGDTVRVGPVPHKAALDFFDSFFAASGHSLTAHVNNAP
jgi:para-nitrobenzyl esterase